MSRHNLRLAATAALVALVPLAGCTPSSTSTPLASSPAGATSLIVRLGNDTLALERYTRTATRMEGVLLQRSPFTTLSHYHIEMGPGNVPTRAEYTLRRGDGSPITGAMQSLSVRYGIDSVTFTAHRASGDSSRTAAASGVLLPYVNGSYGLFELAIARLRSMGRDSIQFGIVPLNFNVRGSTPLAVKLTSGDAARIDWFGYPLFARFDSRARLLGLDGTQSTIKVRVDRVAAANLDSIGAAWTARDQASGPTGQVSTRDTARATIGAAHVWIDYGRPALRGRNVWASGVLGDTLWRTGANAATQLGTDADILIGGTVVPAGTYSLWTSTSGDGYHLVVNKQHGQWGTEYHPAQDLARVPLRESSVAPAVERFTIALAPQGDATVLNLAWGTKQLSVPITAK
ncbi:MAG: DUF2911 domain-containing protein [Gemmatimonadales bacterium]